LAEALLKDRLTIWKFCNHRKITTLTSGSKKYKYTSGGTDDGTINAKIGGDA
jgi:hypothetical protein